MNTHSAELGVVKDPIHLQQSSPTHSTHALEEIVSELTDQVKTLESRLTDVETRLSKLERHNPAQSSKLGIFHHDYDPDHRTW